MTHLHLQLGLRRGEQRAASKGSQVPHDPDPTSGWDRVEEDADSTHRGAAHSWVSVPSNLCNEIRQHLGIRALAAKPHEASVLGLNQSVTQEARLRVLR